MSTFRNPVGPQPSRVYWRRRLIVGLGLLAVVIIIFLILVRPGSGAPTTAPTSTPSSSSTPTSASTDSAGECDPDKITLDATTDQVGYDPGVNPMIGYTIKSTLTTACTMSVGTDLLEYRITSGEELIWTSKDCQTDQVAATAVLQPGVPQAPATIPWDRTRSSADTCDSPRDQVIAGGASYHLEVVLGDLTSTSKQFLLY